MKRIALALLFFVSIAAQAATVRLGNDVVPVRQSIVLEADPREDTFTGSTEIELEVKKATSAFRFHAEAMNIRSMRLLKGERPIDAVRKAGDDSTVTVTAGEKLQRGRYRLVIDYKTSFNRQAVGLYKMVAKGEPYLFTQLEAIDARRMFPGWDEPGFKIPYQLTVTIPAHMDAISNTPVASESKEGERKTVRFQETKPLPTYLIALAVGQFDYTPIEGMSVPGRIIAPRGQGHLAATAAKITPPILAALEKYFDSKHPFEKVDVLAVPEYWAGAMENPGAITFRDTILLLDPAAATPAQQQNLRRVMAHELAHMWFGDLVTMQWWDDFWLNESFADWMGDKITDEVFPEYEHLITEMSSVQGVMNGDMRATQEAVRRADMDPEDAMRTVGLAYNKGKAVLSMFEAWIGAEKFRRGVLAHMDANAWGNATSAEFFASLSKHAPAGTAAALDTFIGQPGIPLVTVDVTGGNAVRLTQKRFTNAKLPPQKWSIPVRLRYSDGTTTRTKALLLDQVSETVQLEGDRIAWIHPDADAAGYYRWQLDDASLATLASRATEVLQPRERVAFLGNLGALFRAGTLHGDAYLEHLSQFANDPNPHVLETVVGAVATVRSTFDSPETRPRFAAYARRTMGPALARIGMSPREGESPVVTGIRPALVSLLARHGDDEAVWQFVNEQLPRYLQDPAAVHPSLVGTLVSLAATRGDAALFDEFQKRFENAKTPADRARYLDALGSFLDPALRQRARDLSLTSAVRPTEIYDLAGSTATEEEREDMYRWITANYDAFTKKLPPAFAAGMPFIAAGCSPERVERAREFFATRKVEGTDRQMARIAEQVSDCAALRAREMEAVSRYLARAPQ